MRSSSIAAVSFGAFGVVLAAACAGKTSDAGPAGASGVSARLPCDVDDVLARNCRQCHSSPPQFGAPMPLVTNEDLKAMTPTVPNKRVFEQVGVRIHDDAAPMPQPPNPRLDARDKATLDDWIARGAPTGTTTCSDAGPSVVGPDALDCTPDQRIRPISKFAMTGTKDVYVCYGFDTVAAEKRHVIAGAPHIDNPRIVHHVLLYQANASVDGTPRPCGAGGGPGWRLVTGWAPGGKNFELPPEAGFAEGEGTTHWPSRSTTTTRKRSPIRSTSRASIFAPRPRFVRTTPTFSRRARWRSSSLRAARRRRRARSRSRRTTDRFTS